MPRVFIPPTIRPLTKEAVVDAHGVTVRDVIEDLERRFPGIKERLCQSDSLRPGLAVAVGDRISSLGLMQRLDEDSEVHFLPTLGGG